MANLRTRLEVLEQATRAAEPEPIIRQPGESAEAWYRRFIEAPAPKPKPSGPSSNLTPEEAYRRVCGVG